MVEELVTDVAGVEVGEDQDVGRLFEGGKGKLFCRISGTTAVSDCISPSTISPGALSLTISTALFTFLA